MITWSQYQEDVFNDLEDMKYEIQSLQGFIQNDYTRMLADGNLTIVGVCDTIPTAMDTFEQSISKLGKIKEKVKEILEYHSLTNVEDDNAKAVAP